MSTAPPASPATRDARVPAEVTTAADDAAAAPSAGAPGTAPASIDALRECIRIAAGLSLAVGVIHAIGTVDHFSHYWLYGVFFMLVTYGQVLWGIALWRDRASARTLAIGAYANLAIVAVWIVSRTIGIPFGPYAFDAEPIGIADAAATVDELLIAAYVAVILLPRLRAVRGLRVLHGPFRVHIGMMMCSASVFAGMLGGHGHG